MDQANSGPGSPLEPALRHDMERRFGCDFSRVRVHSGPAAGQSARDLNALAYTVGHDIVFAVRQFAPTTREGRRLLAHELAHVVQQAQGSSEPPGAAHEDEADRAARSVLDGSSAVLTKASAPGVPQFAPNDELDELLKRGPQSEPPSAAEVKAAVARLNSGTATAADRETLLRQTIAESRAYIQASKAGRPLSYDVLKACCGPGRDVSAASFGALASGSGEPVSISRFQAEEIFGIGKHGFSVVTFANGAKYLVDPTFGQFLRPGMHMDPHRQGTAQVLRADPAGAQMARELVANGFVRLTPEIAQLYARGLGVPEADARVFGPLLLRNSGAVLVERVGRGRQTVFKVPTRGPDIIDRSELIKYLKEEHIPNLKKAGDPHNLLPQLEQLVQRLEPGRGGPPTRTETTTTGSHGVPKAAAPTKTVGKTTPSSAMPSPKSPMEPLGTPMAKAPPPIEAHQFGSPMAKLPSPIEAHRFGSPLAKRPSPMETHQRFTMPPGGSMMPSRAGRFSRIAGGIAGGYARALPLAALDMLMNYLLSSAIAEIDRDTIKKWWQERSPEIQTAVERLTPSIEKLRQETLFRKTIYANIQVEFTYVQTMRITRGGGLGGGVQHDWRVTSLKLIGVEVSTQDIERAGPGKIESAWGGVMDRRPFTYSVPIVEPKPVMTPPPSIMQLLRVIGSGLDNVIGDLRRMATEAPIAGPHRNRAQSIERDVFTFLGPARTIVEGSRPEVERADWLLGEGIQALENTFSTFSPNPSPGERDLLGRLHVAKYQLEALLRDWPME